MKKLLLALLVSLALTPMAQAATTARFFGDKLTIVIDDYDSTTTLDLAKYFPQITAMSVISSTLNYTTDQTPTVSWVIGRGGESMIVNTETFASGKTYVMYMQPGKAVVHLEDETLAVTSDYVGAGILTVVLKRED